MKTLKSFLLGTFVVAPIVVGSTFLFLNAVRSDYMFPKDRKQQEIVRNPAGTIEYSVEKGDGIDRILRKYSNIPSSVDPRDVREYTLETNGKKTSDLAIGETIKLPVYKNK
ncbi:hypothetical protein J4433_01035 [Candidatus Pacearchaeota archaeon]|nr:hypothetical protein [Candidatus Pacearchaeota archaeon]